MAERKYLQYLYCKETHTKDERKPLDAVCRPGNLVTTLYRCHFSLVWCGECSKDMRLPAPMRTPNHWGEILRL